MYFVHATHPDRDAQLALNKCCIGKQSQHVKYKPNLNGKLEQKHQAITD